MTTSIHERLSRVEENFLQATVQGLPALAAFQDEWSTLLSDTDHAVQTNNITQETKVLANIVSSRIATLSNYLLEFQSSADSIETELEAAFAQVDISDNLDNQLRHPPHLISTFFHNQHAEKHPVSAHSSAPSYIKPAYRWLLDNLHNPYPSKEIRQGLSDVTGSHRKVIDAWFVDARKRIGWNALRKERFTNKRIEIVDAASRFFGEPDSKRPLDATIQMEFVVIETRSKDLYSEKFVESTLAAKLDIAVKDMTPGMKAQAIADERRRRQLAKEANERTAHDAQAVSSYPSPHLSPSHTPEPTQLQDELDLAVIPPLSVTGRKRSNSPEALSDFNSDVFHERPNKRPRLDISSKVDARASLPSPAPSIEDLCFIDDTPPTYPAVQYSDLLTVPTSRKRRLSDADIQSAPKRPRHILSGPRLHAVSDPLPPSSVLSSWFESNFGISNAAIVDQSDLTQPFDVELYDYSHPSTQMESLNDTYPSVPLCPSFEVSLAVPVAPSHSLNISTNDFDYNELFSEPEENPAEDLEQNTMNRPDEICFPTFDPSTFELNFEHDSFDRLTTIPDTAIIADSSSHISQNPESNFDWMFPPSLLPQNPYSVQAIGFCALPQNEPLGSEFSKTVLRDFPQDAFSHISDKTAKQRKLMEMKEATRRLEAEIAAS